MLKIFKFLFFLTVLIFLSSCFTVTRWSRFSEEIQNKELPMNIEYNIFHDFLWTTPPIYSRQINFKSNGKYEEAKIKFGNKDLTFRLNIDDEISLDYEGNQNNTFYSARLTKNNMYYDLDILKTKVVPKQRLVTKTRFVTKTVSVMKTMPVMRTRSVTVFNADGTTSTRMETYTDYQTVWETELRTVPETYTEWETVYETVIDIPEYHYYSFSLGDGQSVAVYKVLNRYGKTEYYFQNTTYLTAINEEESFLGTYDVNLLIIDTNSNGYYFEDNDAILFNSWNPYEQNSDYREVSNYMDNYWYRFSELENERFITFTANNENNRLLIKNANSKYINSNELGKIIMTNIPFDAWLYINGENYMQQMDGDFKRKIEYGIYNVKVILEGYPDFETKFIINEDNPEVTLDYKLPEEGGVIKFENDYLRNWTIIVTDEDGNEKHYYNRNTINLKEGSYKIIISAAGFKLVKKYNIKAGDKIRINYGREIEKLANDR